MKVLVTGCCGFIGSNFLRYLLEKQPSYEVVNLDKLTYAGNPENLKDLALHKRYKFAKGDICDAKKVTEVARGADIIINFAAESHVDRSIEDANQFVTTNVYGTYVLLEAARKYGIKRFIQVSTDEVYGSIKKGSFKETDRLEPSSPYSSSKAGADLLALSYYHTYKLPVIVCRSTNNYGPYQNPEKLIPLFITNAMQDKKLPLYGDGQNVRDWIYVQDNCEAIDTVLHRGKTGEIYNIGSGTEKKNIEVTKTILNHMDKPQSLIQKVPDRLGHDFRYSLDTTKICALGWKPTHTFEEGIRKTIKWYQGNCAWIENIRKRNSSEK
jgi:dTDP-glucose 4,6-dehydratase